MKLVPFPHRLLTIVVAVGVLAACAGVARAQNIAALNQKLTELEAKMGRATNDQSVAGQVINQLDGAEALFAKLASNPKTSKAGLVAAYPRLDDMLKRMYQTYKRKKEECIDKIANGGQCDYTQPEQLSLRALYPLSWLRFQAATSIYSNNASQAKRMLNKAIDGFTESTLVIFVPNLVRENLLGRAYCERELGKYVRSEYQNAIKDFKTIMADGRNTKQYKAAQQGLATTYAAMGKMEQAAKLSNRMVASGGGANKRGMTMFRLQNLFKAEAATRDPKKRATYHAQAVTFMKTQQKDKKAFAVVVASVAKYVRDPVAEFGHSKDPFEIWVLANVLYSKKKTSQAAKYFLQAGRSGKYPRAYKFAADIYYRQRNYGRVEQVVNEIARQRGNPYAQWAVYMRYKLPAMLWDRGGRKSAQLEAKWVKAGEAYLHSYPRGRYAYDPRFKLAERLQRQGHLLKAAAEYKNVSGNSNYVFTSRYKAAECYYLALVEAGKVDNKKKAPVIKVADVRKAAIAGLKRTIEAEPQAERRNPSRRKFMRETRGRAIYMLASLLHDNRKVDQREMADLLAGYEKKYPSMHDRFEDIGLWRLAAYNALNRYGDIERDIKGVLERARGNHVSRDFIKIIGTDLWKSAKAREVRGDKAGYKKTAALTALIYSYFSDKVASGEIPAKNLTGTLPILGQAYIAMGKIRKAEDVFNIVVKADAGSVDANAGLARIAQAKKQWKKALKAWTTVKDVAAESDPLWYEAQYEMAVIYFKLGNITAACSQLASTRAQHPSLGSPEMKVQWNALQRRRCLKKG